MRARAANFDVLGMQTIHTERIPGNKKASIICEPFFVRPNLLNSLPPLDVDISQTHKGAFFAHVAHGKKVSTIYLATRLRCKCHFIDNFSLPLLSSSWQTCLQIKASLKWRALADVSTRRAHFLLH